MSLSLLPRSAAAAIDSFPFPFALLQHRISAMQHVLGGTCVADTSKPLLIKRYASRRLYNTETSDYVTLEDIASFIRDGREVQIVDLKSGDDLTRQFLLQIIAEHESRGESVLGVDILTDLVRSYTTQASSVVPQFLTASFEMLREGQSKAMDNMTKASPLGAMPGFEAMRAQQQAFFQAMSGGLMGGIKSAPKEPQKDADDLDTIKQQLAAMQEKISRMGK
jgi:polyhydroxyalkanoate synthesis repressor PhaR